MIAKLAKIVREGFSEMICEPTSVEHKGIRHIDNLGKAFKSFQSALILFFIIYQMRLHDW